MPVTSVINLPQLNEVERARADVAAQRLTGMLMDIEVAMARAAQAIVNLEKRPQFIGVQSRLAMQKQHVAEYRAALHRAST